VKENVKMEYQERKPRRERSRGKQNKEVRDSFDANCRRMQKQRIRKEKHGY
jgi:hypothetical protein